MPSEPRDVPLFLQSAREFPFTSSGEGKSTQAGEEVCPLSSRDQARPQGPQIGASMRQHGQVPHVTVRSPPS